MREAAEGRPFLDHLKAPRRGGGEAKRSGGANTPRTDHETERGNAPPRRRASSRQNAGVFEARRRGGAGHREATQKAPATTHARGHRGRKAPEQRQNTEVFPREAHKKHTKNQSFLTVFTPFTRHLEAFCGAFAKAVYLTHTTRKPLIYKALRRFEAKLNPTNTAYTILLQRCQYRLHRKTGIKFLSLYRVP